METSNVLKVEPRLKVDNEYDMLESKNVHHYFGMVDSGDVSQLNDMSFGEETHSNDATANTDAQTASGNVTQINGKYVKPICNRHNPLLELDVRHSIFECGASFASYDPRREHSTPSGI